MRESYMHKIKRSTRGASLLIALLVFFLAALSGTVVLTMAASNAGRYTHEKEDQQTYLSVISAGNLILDRLKGLEIEYKGKTTDVPTEKDKDKITITYQVTGKQDLFLADEGFKENLMEFSLTGEWEIMEFYLEAENGMGTVCVSVDASGSDFFFRLYHVSGSARNYQMTLNVKAKFDAYTRDPDDNLFKKHLSFLTDSEHAQYLVEKTYGEA